MCDLSYTIKVLGRRKLFKKDHHALYYHLSCISSLHLCSDTGNVARLAAINLSNTQQM